MRRENLTNKKFGRLLVLDAFEKTKTGLTKWLCLCDCGNRKFVYASNLKRGNTMSCGCLHKDVVSANLKGRVFGKLLVLRKFYDDEKRGVSWVCVCECGGGKIVNTDNLSKGSIKSCGCLKRDLENVKCDYCGKATKKNRQSLNNNRKNFCSKDCQYNWKSDNMSGENAPGWLGGISHFPYCPIWGKKEFKEYVKSLDGNKCKNPDCFGKSDRLCLHHIDYDKMNCDKSNLITLCVSCNSRANKNRAYHTLFYQEIIKQRGLNNG